MLIEKDTRSKLEQTSTDLYHIIDKDYIFNLKDVYSCEKEDMDNIEKIKDYLIKHYVNSDEADEIFARLRGVYITLKSIGEISFNQLDNLAKNYNICWTIQEQNFVPSSVLSVQIFCKEKPYTANNIQVEIIMSKTEWHYHYRDDHDITFLYLKQLPEDDFTVGNEESPHYSDLGIYENVGYKNNDVIYYLYLNYFKTIDLDKVQEYYPEYQYYNELKNFQKKLNSI